MAEKEFIKDACGVTNYDDPEHRRNPEVKDGPPKGESVMMAYTEQETVRTTVTNSGERRAVEVGDGKGISEGEGALITAFNGGYKDVNESQKKYVKSEREQK